jgi:methyl-accepting chemotaxis protein
MKLGIKITFSFVFFIVLLGSINILTNSYLLDKKMEHDLETSEVMFNEVIAKKISRFVNDKNTLPITDILFDEKKLREEKIEYIIVIDNYGYMLAHTYLSLMPKQLKSHGGIDYGDRRFDIARINNDELNVYCVSIPVMEGIKKVGEIHVGYKADYLEDAKNELIITSLIITCISVIVAIVIALFLSHLIVGPINKLSKVSDELTNGDFNVEVPIIKSKDEIGKLASLIAMLVAIVKQNKNKK